MPKPVGLIGLSDYRLRLVASRRPPPASSSPAACPRDECVDFLRSLADYRGAAGTAGAIEARRLHVATPGFANTGLEFQLKQRGIELGRSRLEGGRVHESPGHLAPADVI